MNKDGAMFLMIVGLIITFGGVGGIEVSGNDRELMGSMIVASWAWLPCTVAYWH